jgi:ribosomal protein S2
MKIKKIISYKTKLFQLNLIKTKVHREKIFLHKINIKNIEYRLKRALQIIYQYQVNQKKILFLGLSNNFVRKIKQLPNTNKHTFIPESIWVNGVISNQISIFKYLSKNSKLSNDSNLKILFNLKTQYNLIVIFDQNADQNALIESYQARIPIISFSGNLDILNDKPTYKIPGNFKLSKKKIRANFFFSMLLSIFKKANYFNSDILNKKIKSNAFYKKK